MVGAAGRVGPGGHRERIARLQMEAWRVWGPGKSRLAEPRRNNGERGDAGRLHCDDCPETADERELAATHRASIMLTNGGIEGINTAGAGAAAAIHSPPIDRVLSGRGSRD